MTIAPPVGGDESTPQIGETEVAGPATILADNLGVVAGQNLGISLGQNFAVPTFQRTGIGPHQPDEHNPGFVLAEPHQDAVTQLRSLRHSLRLFLIVQREFQRILPVIARITTIREKEPAPLWASLAPDAGMAHAFYTQRQESLQMGPDGVRPSRAQQRPNLAAGMRIPGGGSRVAAPETGALLSARENDAVHTDYSATSH